MNLIFLITISLACLIFLLYPYFNNSKNKINDLQIYSEIRIYFILSKEYVTATTFFYSLAYSFIVPIVDMKKHLPIVDTTTKTMETTETIYEKIIQSFLFLVHYFNQNQ